MIAPSPDRLAAAHPESSRLPADATTVPGTATLGRAIALAAMAHQGQETKLGEPFILHPLRVMLRVGGEAERQVAALHDVVENTGWTLERLRAEGFDERVVEAVDALSRRQGESYEDFVRRTVATPLAVPVKHADLLDNLAMTRRLPSSGKNRKRIARYRAALEVVAAAQGGFAQPTRSGLLLISEAIAARLLALDQLRQMERVVAASDRVPGPDTVHDLRVAIRHLRSLMRSHPMLKRATGRKGRRRLKTLATAAGRVRDLDVRLVWLESLPGELNGTATAVRLQRRLRKDRDRAARALVGRMRTRFHRLIRRLHTRIGRLDHTDAAAIADAPPFGNALAAALDGLRQGLADALAAARPGDATALHAARIAGKRLRYALEPLGADFHADTAVARLTRLQDLLGTARDLTGVQRELDTEVARTRDERAHSRGARKSAGAGSQRDEAREIQSLKARANTEREALAAQFVAEWLGDHAQQAAATLGIVAEIVERLEGVEGRASRVESRESSVER